MLDKLIKKVTSFLTTDNQGFSLKNLIYNAVLFYLIFVTFIVVKLSFNSI